MLDDEIHLVIGQIDRLRVRRDRGIDRRNNAGKVSRHVQPVLATSVALERVDPRVDGVAEPALVIAAEMRLDVMPARAHRLGALFAEIHAGRVGVRPEQSVVDSRRLTLEAATRRRSGRRRLTNWRG